MIIYIYLYEHLFCYKENYNNFNIVGVWNAFIELFTSYVLYRQLQLEGYFLEFIIALWQILQQFVYICVNFLISVVPNERCDWVVLHLS